MIDADLRNPSVARLLGVSEARGVADFVTDPSVSLDEVVIVQPSANISVIPAGNHDMAPYESLGSPRFVELIDEARKRYDFVIVDTPPLMPMPDTRQVANWVDGMIVVVGAHRTPRRLLEMALSTLEPSKIVGLVFNGDDACTPRYYGRYAGELDRTTTQRQVAADERRHPPTRYREDRSSVGRPDPAGEWAAAAT